MPLGDVSRHRWQVRLHSGLRLDHLDGSNVEKDIVEREHRSSGFQKECDITTQFSQVKMLRDGHWLVCVVFSIFYESLSYNPLKRHSDHLDPCCK